MISQTEIDNNIRDLFDNIEFPSTPANLYDPLRYMIAIGGKRVRPKLCLTTYSLYKDSLHESILQPAAALEVFHSFTLIHDDIMDHSPIRRGKPTVWLKWGEDSAILSGDVMSIDSYKRLAKAPADKIQQALELFSTTAAQVCDGQQYDMDFEDREEVTMQEYIGMIGLKTGVLIACSAKLGALIADARPEDCNNLYLYGYHLGLAFQVADDYLDAYGDEKIFGKAIGGDILNNKKCWLTTRALEKADTLTKIQLKKAMSQKANSEEEKRNKILAVKNIYNTLGIEDEAKKEILQLNEKALEYAGLAVQGPQLHTLMQFAEQLVGRSF